MITNLSYSRIRTVKSPNKGTKEAAGLDLFLPEFTEGFIRDFGEKNQNCIILSSSLTGEPGVIKIFPRAKAFIPSGLRFNIPQGFALFVHNKGGVSWKQCVTTIADTIDSDYQGEVFITLQNYSDEAIYLDEGQKYIQLILLPIPEYDLNEIAEKDLFIGKESERGEGAMGSTTLTN